LFGVALFAKGFTHDLLIEVAVFLVSVKLIVMTYSNSVASKKLEKKLSDIEEKIEQLLEKKNNVLIIAIVCKLIQHHIC